MIALVDVWCSQALARLRWSDEVVSGDVDEAIRLMMMSKVIMIVIMIVMMTMMMMILM
jgi:DNA replicative helicase MCM subunit Mcm2 (Cdc46/Mcm family)